MLAYVVIVLECSPAGKRIFVTLNPLSESESDTVFPNKASTVLSVMMQTLRGEKRALRYLPVSARSPSPTITSYGFSVDMVNFFMARL